MNNKVPNMKNLRTMTCLALSIFLMEGCKACKKPTNNIEIYEVEMKNDILSLNNDFKKKAGDRIHFAFDSSVVSNKDKAILIKQAEWLSNNPGAQAEIEGNCDDTATNEYNLSLGLKRAQAVQRFLVEHGINPSRLTVTSYGKDRPEAYEAYGHSKYAHRINRSAVTKIVK